MPPKALPATLGSAVVVGGGKEGVISCRQHHPPLLDLPRPQAVCGGGSSGQEGGWKREGEKWLRGSPSLSRTPTPASVRESRPAVSDSLVLAAPPKGVEAEAPEQRGRLSPAEPRGKGRGVRVGPAGAPPSIWPLTAGPQAGGKQRARAGGQEPSLNVVWGLRWAVGGRNQGQRAPEERSPYARSWLPKAPCWRR